MSAMRLHFTWSDAWVLAAIAIAGDTEGATIKEIIAAGDAVNGTLFSAKELRRGMAKLTRAGYVRFDGQLFTVAGTAADFSLKILKRRGSAFCIMQALEAYLGAEPYSLNGHDEKDQDWPFQGLSDEAVAAACISYREETVGDAHEARARAGSTA
jgi:hypothetical protein